MYKYIRVHKRTYRSLPSLKKCKQISNSQSCAYLTQSLPLRYGATDLNAGEGEEICYCIYHLVVSNSLSVHLAADDESTALRRRSRRAAAPSHDIPRPSLRLDVDLVEAG